MHLRSRGTFFFSEHANRERADTKWQWEMTDLLKNVTSNVECRRARESDEGNETAMRNGGQDTEKGQ